MIEGIDRQIIIVGGGPAGLYCAYLIRKSNPDIYVVVIEANKTIGENVCCGGLIEINGFRNLKLSESINIEECVLNKVRCAEIYAPHKTILEIKAKENKTYVIDRSIFDKKILALAKSVGVSIITESRVVEVNAMENIVVVKNLLEDKTTELKYDFLIGADGPNSMVRQGLENVVGFENKDFVYAYQVLAKGDFSDDRVYVFFGEFSKGFFGWVIPLSKGLARVGVGTKAGKNPKDAFENFINKTGLNISCFSEECFGVIPVSKPLKTYVAENRLVIGDAACFVKATSGGGINFGLASSEIAAKAINQRIKNFKDLKNYNKLLSSYISELGLHYKIHKYIESKNQLELEELFVKMKKLGVEDFLGKSGNMDWPSRFLPLLLIKPKFVMMLPEFVKLIRT